VEADHDPQNIWDAHKDGGSFIDEKLQTLHCQKTLAITPTLLYSYSIT